MTPAPLLSPTEEVECLKNLLSDPDDEVSQRLLQLHYAAMARSVRNRWDQ